LNKVSESKNLSLIVSILIAVLLAVITISFGCEKASDGNSQASAPKWEDVDDWLYLLQNIDISAVGETKFDLAVMDYSADGSDETRFSAEEIDALKHSSGGEKLVLSYISIGEAEDYRWYWDESWDADHDGTPDEGSPSWLGPENPDWEGNYKVKYWEDGWQEIVFEYLDKILDAKFDGAYLDCIDTYEYWAPGGESGLDRESAEDEMVEFVKNIARYVREQSGNDDFGVFVQNAEELSAHSDYLNATTGIGKEDLWYNDNTPNPSDEVSYSIEQLDRFKDSGKLVLVVDYVTEPSLIDDFYTKAQAKGYVPYATTRELDRITINPGHEPD